MAFDFPYDDWANIYDAVYADLDHDIDFYVEQAVNSGGPVLEIGCGTGRISLSIAAKGIDVVGIDISPRMIEVARAKAEKRGLTPHCIFQPGDMASLELADRYPLIIMPFRSFQSMLSVQEQRQALTGVKSHLSPGGSFVLDTFNPDVRQLADAESSASPVHLQDVAGPDGGTIVVWGQNGWDSIEQVNEVRLIIEEVSDEGVVNRRLFRDFDQRYTFRYEMQHLLELCGFTIQAVYGDFDGGEITEDTEDIVWIAKTT